MPLRLPIRKLHPHEFDDRLACGDRRHGQILYRPTCAACQACEAIRLRVWEFAPSASHRRVLKHAEPVVRVEVGEPVADAARVVLYEKHLAGRGLKTRDHPAMTLDRYASFMLESCCNSVELRLLVEDQLVGVSVTDVGNDAMSAHYCFWDPDLARLCLGTYAILKQVELCRRWRLRYLYLGLYIARNRSMCYKARYRPHERHIAGEWVVFR